MRPARTRKEEYGHGLVAKKSGMKGEMMRGGTMLSRSGEPPTVKELQRIAEDIRRGLY